jgi:hypothetical protein
VFQGRTKSRAARRKVLDDWIAVLPHAKDEMYQIVVRRWECSYAMMSVALDEAMSLRSAGELVCARQQVSIAAGLLSRLAPSLISLCDTLSSRGQRVTRLPVVEPMNADFFRGDTGQSAASWNQILHHVLFSARSRFFHKLRILSHTLATLEYEFEEAAGDISRNLATQPGDCWQRLDNLHYDFNTCLRESEVVLKSFLRILPDDQLTSLASELDAPPTPRRLRARARFSDASVSA